MKKTIKLLCIIAFITIIGLSMTNCGDDNNNSDESGYLGKTLNLSGQVWTYDGDNDQFVKFNGANSK